MVKFTLIALVLFFAASAIAEEELKSETTFLPENCPRKSKKNDRMTMHYQGTLEDGTEFDSSYKRNEPFKFQLGVGQVIRGWDQGLLDMCVGEKRKLIIPHTLAYGEEGAGSSIPPRATLHFDVECVDIQDGDAPGNVFDEIDTNKDKQICRTEVRNYLKGKMPSDMEEDKLIEEIFQHEDLDKNGFISLEEFLQ